MRKKHQPGCPCCDQEPDPCPSRINNNCCSNICSVLTLTLYDAANNPHEITLTYGGGLGGARWVGTTNWTVPQAYRPKKNIFDEWTTECDGPDGTTALLELEFYCDDFGGGTYGWILQGRTGACQVAPSGTCVSAPAPARVMDGQTLPLVAAFTISADPADVICDPFSVEFSQEPFPSSTCEGAWNYGNPLVAVVSE